MQLSPIEWTDCTWNPIRGCSRVSEGCRNCYAEGVAYRFSGPGMAYEGLLRVGAAGKRKREWNGQIKFVEKHLLDPLKWGPVKLAGPREGEHHAEPVYRPRRIFVNSMSDLFHESVTDEMRNKIFAVMALNPQHTFQILTKRPERMAEYVTRMTSRWILRLSHAICESPELIESADAPGRPMPSWPLPNVWLGVSVEHQAAADQRIPLLLETPAAVRFLSCEPLLGSLSITKWIDRCPCSKSSDGFSHAWLFDGDDPYVVCHYCHERRDVLSCRVIGDKRSKNAGIDWVIVGGESGAGARPMHPEWARSLRDQCVAQGVPFFFKQWGEWGSGELVRIADVDHLSAMDASGEEWALSISNGKVSSMGPRAQSWSLDRPVLPRQDLIALKRVGKKKAGHLLDGKEWHQFPGGAR